MNVKRRLSRPVDGSWTKALEQARLMLARAKAQVHRLELAVKTREEKVKDKDPWPC